jgi:hypothetical protein
MFALSQRERIVMQPRALKLAIASVFVGAGLVACERYESGPAPTTATAGSGAPQREQLQYQQPGSAPVSQGTPTLGGGTTSGRPSIERTGPGSGDLGGSPEIQPRGSRGSRSGP